MSQSSLQSLRSFGISQKYGFLPDQLPLTRLPDAYTTWEVILQNLPALIKTRCLRGEADAMPVLSTLALKSQREWQRAYVVLSFLAHGYIWGGEMPSEYLPPPITCPFLKVSTYLGLPPVATYASLSLWNFSMATSEADRCQPDNIKSLHTVTGTSDEAWFYAISIAMEARGGPMIRAMLEAIDAASAGDSRTVSVSLRALSKCLDDLGSLLERMHEKCDPEIFYHEIRPLLAGSKNMAVAGLPRGVFYDMGCGMGEWQQYSGGSNAQSSLIQFFDIVLGVEHYATGEINLSKNTFMQEMRQYMPHTHRDFLDCISQTKIRDYVMQQDHSHPIIEDYSNAVKMLATLRDKHIQIATRYIVLQSRKVPSKRNTTRCLNLAVGSTVASSGTVKAGLCGTGGTQLIPFLKQTRDETRNMTIKLS